MSWRAAGFGVVVALGALALDVLVLFAMVGPVPIEAITVSQSAVILPVPIAALIVAIAAGRVPTRRADAWLRDRGLPVEDFLRDAASRWIRRTRTARAVGFTLLFVSGSTPAWFVNISGLPVGDPLRDELLRLVMEWPVRGWSAPIAGYAAGALVADLTRRSLDDGTGLRAAALEPRPVAGYLQPLSRWGPRVLAVVALLVALGTSLAGLEASWAMSSRGLAIVAVVALLLNEAVVRGVVRRRQRASDAVAIAFDDAARATTVHAVAGSTIGILGLTTADVWQLVAVSSGWAAGILGFALAIGSFFVWLGHGVELAHRVRRPDLGPAA